MSALNTEVHFLTFCLNLSVFLVFDQDVVNAAATKLRRLGFGLYPVFLIADGLDQVRAKIYRKI